jgi:hypothetical protein
VSLAPSHANQHKPAPAEIARGRMHDRQRKPGGHRRIHRVSARLHDFDSGSGTQIMYTDHDGVGGVHGLRGGPSRGRDGESDKQQDH